MTATNARPAAPAVDLNLALAHLAAAGVTTAELSAAGVDITDPAALVSEVGQRQQSLLAEDTLTERDRVVEYYLRQAGKALTSAAERARQAALAADIAAFLAYKRGLTNVPPPPRRYDAQ